jgi:hypothetical protein
MWANPTILRIFQKTQVRSWREDSRPCRGGREWAAENTPEPLVGIQIALEKQNELLDELTLVIRREV